jgi:hypothetical protein
MQGIITPGRARAAVAAFAFLHFFFGLFFITTHSATYDEPMHAAAGFALWKTGDARLDPNNPPLAKLIQSFPIAMSAPVARWDVREWREGFHYGFGERFLFWSGNDGLNLLKRARGMTLLLSIGLLLTLWSWSRKRWGEVPGLLTVGLYAGSPTLTAHASLATNDFPAAACVLLSVLAFIDFLEKGEKQNALLCGVWGFAGFLCKYSAVLIWPGFIAVFLWRELRCKSEGFAKIKIFLGWTCLPVLIGVGIYFLAYEPAWTGFWTRVWQVSAGKHPAFLFGEVSDSGWPHYYAVALGVKTSLPEWGAALLLMTAAWKCSNARSVWPLGIIAFIYFISASLGHKQIGIRYLLVLYPLLAVSAAAGAVWVLKESKKGSIIIFALIAGQVSSFVIASPHLLSYANLAAGGSSNSYRILADSNVDWGQELAALGRMHKSAGRPEVILSYFGTASAESYGIRAQQVLATNAITRRHRNSDHPRAEWLVVSATHLQGVYIGAEAFSWLRDRAPDRRVGGSLFLYDITEDADTHIELARMYDAAGDSALAARERRRAAIIQGTLK